MRRPNVSEPTVICKPFLHTDYTRYIRVTGNITALTLVYRRNQHLVRDVMSGCILKSDFME